MAAANLRAAAYDIPTQTWFDAKGMAGNIVHAVATTNAVISGLITLEAMKLLARAPAACRVCSASCPWSAASIDRARISGCFCFC